MNEEQPVFTGRDIYESFAMELQQWSRTGKAPYQADQDLAWVLENQYARLRGRGLELEYDIVPRGNSVNVRELQHEWKDGHYITTMKCRSCRFRRTLRRRGKKVSKWKKNVLMAQYITDVYDIYAAGQDNHICPNCGAPSTLAGLLDGCDYCGTRFRMPDLYPKVSNYCYMQDILSLDEILGDIGKTVLKTIPWTIIFFQAANLMGEGDINEKMAGIADSLFIGCVTGILIGNARWVFGKMAKLVKAVWQSIRLQGQGGDTEERFETQMRMYSPEFSYGYFVNKVVNLLKTVLFSEDPRALPFYSGEDSEDFLNILDSKLFGDVSLQDFRVVDGICYVTVDACMDNLYDASLGIREKREWFRLEMYRDVSKPVELHFSIHRIQCGGCGGSFDATRHKTCPHCGRPYGLQDMDWVVQSVRKRSRFANKQKKV